MEEEIYKLKYCDDYLDHIEKHLKLSGRNEKAVSGGTSETGGSVSCTGKSMMTLAGG